MIFSPKNFTLAHPLHLEILPYLKQIRNGFVTGGRSAVSGRGPTSCCASEPMPVIIGLGLFI